MADDYENEAFDNYSSDGFDRVEDDETNENANINIIASSSILSSPPTATALSPSTNIAPVNNYHDHQSYTSSFATSTSAIGSPLAKIKLQKLRQSTNNKKYHQRLEQIRQCVTLSEESFDLFELAPVSAFDLHIRDIAQGRVISISSQYNDDWSSQETQTVHPEEQNSGCQCPEDLLMSCGAVDSQRLTKFVVRASQVIEEALCCTATSLDDNEADKRGTQANRQEKFSFSNLTSASASKSTTVGLDTKNQNGFKIARQPLALPSSLQSRPVRCVMFSRTHPNLVAVGYGLPARNSSIEKADSKTQSDSNRDAFPKWGLVIVWDLSNPHLPLSLCYCHGEPRCCAWSEGVIAGGSGGVGSSRVGRPYILFAGLVDGSLVVWDLRENSAQQRIVDMAWNDNQTVSKITVRKCSYSTAGLTDMHSGNLSGIGSSLMDDSCHSVPIRSLCVLPSASTHSHWQDLVLDLFDDDSVKPSRTDSKSTSSSSNFSIHMLTNSEKSFHIASLDDRGGCLVWTVVELKESDLAGSCTDLGLNVGGRVKLIKSAVVTPPSPSLSPLCATVLSFHNQDSNELMIGYENGLLQRLRRFGAVPHPKSFSAWPVISTPHIDSCVAVQFCPHASNLVLVIYQSGKICIFNVNRCSTAVWTANVPGSQLVDVCWSFAKPGVFFVIDNCGVLTEWDITMDKLKPMASLEVVSPSQSISADEFSFKLHGVWQKMESENSLPEVMVLSSFSNQVVQIKGSSSSQGSIPHRHNRRESFRALIRLWS